MRPTKVLIAKLNHNMLDIDMAINATCCVAISLIGLLSLASYWEHLNDCNEGSPIVIVIFLSTRSFVKHIRQSNARLARLLPVQVRLLRYQPWLRLASESSRANLLVRQFVLDSPIQSGSSFLEFFMPRLILLIVAAVVLSAFSRLHAADKPNKASQPNIIYILLDDAGYGDLSCYGQKKFATPHIDRLAKEGMKFTQHYAGCTVCAPTRCVLMTGLHTGHSYVRGNREVQPEGQAAIPGDTVTVSKLLQKAGYVTGAFGKWGLGAPGSEGEPNQQGFDRFYGYNCQREAHTYYPTHLWSDTKKVPLDGKTYAHDLIMTQALNFITAKREKPFFCFLPVTIPHAAMHVPEEYAAPFRKQFPEFENKIGKYKGPLVKNPIAAFAGMMTKLDDDVGDLLSTIKKLGIDENTIIMLTSDNGPHQEGGHDPKFFDSNGPLRGFKRDLYDGGVRVPLLARWPGKIKPNSLSTHISAHWDMLPTFCELAKTPAPKTDGISMVDELLGQKQDQHKYLYWEFYERGGRRAARFGNWKAVQLNVHKNLNAPIELFDLDKDMGETKNIAAAHPEQIKRAQEIFHDAHSPSQHWRFGQKKKPKKKVKRN
jgi:arylsulfatase A